MTPTPPSDPDMQFSDAGDNRPYAFTDEGQGPPILAVHGAPGSVGDWRSLAPFLENQVRLLRLDFPGFGGTPLQSGPSPRTEERAQWVMAVADDLRLDQFVAMGHSLGGAVAMELAARWPDRIRGVALIASVGITAHQAIRRHRHIGTLSTILRLPVVGPALTPAVRRGLLHSGFRRGLTNDAVHQSIHLAAAVNFERNRCNVGHIESPALVAWTDDDPFVEEPISRQLADSLPPGPRLHFESGGHNIQKTRAEEIGKSLIEWAGSLFPSEEKPTLPSGDTQGANRP